MSVKYILQYIIALFAFDIIAQFSGRLLQNKSSMFDLPPFLLSATFSFPSPLAWMESALSDDNHPSTFLPT